MGILVFNVVVDMVCNSHCQVASEGHVAATQAVVNVEA